MHADEANQAVKTGELLEAGTYVYDPHDHHGPTLYYAALPIASLRGETTLASLSETTVRLVPAIFGTIGVLLLGFLAATAAGRHASARQTWIAAVAAAFLAVSPPAVYYSRYFIQETLLVTFTLAALLSVLRWWQSGRTGWAIAAGVCAGLMQATKSSAPLFLVLAFLAVMAARVSRPAAWPAWRHVGFAAGAAALTLAVFYSSFGTNPRGLVDALAAYAHALTRLGGETGHEKPWWYYMHMFGWFRTGGMAWHQLAFSALVLAGLLMALRSQWCMWKTGQTGTPEDAALRVAGNYAILVAAAFALIAYKTPWHVIHLVPGFALLAAAALGRICRLRTGVFAAIPLAAFALATLLQQTQRAAFLRPADARNPYAYVHSSPDVRKYRALAEEALRIAPGRPIRVISEEYWPLPWYFRGLPNVGYWPAPPEHCDGAMLVVSLNNLEAVRQRLAGSYRERILGLRPGVLLVVLTAENSP